MSQHSTDLSDRERKSGIAGAGNPAADPDVLTCTVRDACRISGLGQSTIWKLIAEDRLEVVRVYNRTLIVMPSLRRLLTPSE
jgi:hypothetical protein